MIPLNLKIALLIGTVLMLAPTCVISYWYRIKVWKTIIVTVLLTVAGTLGTYVWYYIENGSLGGISFYGAVFLAPILLAILSPVLKIQFGRLMDICAVGECIMLAFMKVQCIVGGCCGGRVLFIASDGAEVRFPSQIAELVNGLLIMAVLGCLARKKPYIGKLYPMYMIIYGCTRFVLNLLRADQSPFFLGLAPGSVWSLVAIVAGIVWLVVLKQRAKHAGQEMEIVPQEGI